MEDLSGGRPVTTPEFTCRAVSPQPFRRKDNGTRTVSGATQCWATLRSESGRDDPTLPDVDGDQLSVVAVSPVGIVVKVARLMAGEVLALDG